MATSEYEDPTAQIPCKDCRHPKAIHEHYAPSGGAIFARNTPEGRQALMDKVKDDVVATWCATKGCSCKKFKMSFRNRVDQLVAKLRR
jgi:hypothetical protein